MEVLGRTVGVAVRLQRKTKEGGTIRTAGSLRRKLRRLGVLCRPRLFRWECPNVLDIDVVVSAHLFQLCPVGVVNEIEEQFASVVVLDDVRANEDRGRCWGVDRSIYGGWLLYGGSDDG